MPPRDPKLCPDLERALPRDALEAGDPAAEYRRDRSPWEFLFGDGEWHRVTVRSWRLDKLGRQVVQVEWRAESSTWEGSYLADAEKMRER